MHQIHDMRETVKLREAALLMGVHPKTAEDIIKSGELPAGKIGRSHILLRSDVLKYVEKKIMAQTAARRAKLHGAQPEPKRERRPSR